jgi:hypothetical protein
MRMLQILILSVRGCGIACLLAGCAAAFASARAQTHRVPIEEAYTHDLILTEITRLGSFDGPDDAFARIRGVALDAKLRLYVADELSHEVRVFEPNGRLVRVIGREGRGPGEFEAPWTVAVDPTDSLWVWDDALRRFSVFSPDGAFARSFVSPQPWLVTNIRFPPSGTVLLAAFGRADGYGLHRLTRDGQTIDEFLRIVVDTTIYRGLLGSLYGGSADVSPDGQIVYSSKSRYRVAILDSAGTELRTCIGRDDWTTKPKEVVDQTQGSVGLRWEDYIHSSAIFAIPSVGYLNAVYDNPNEQTHIDVVTSDCRLLLRSTQEALLGLRDLRDGYLVATTLTEYPEVIVYRLAVKPSR